jgi:hypothetical protein
MEKLIATFAAMALTLALGGFAYAADEGQDQAQQQSQGDNAKLEQYQAALKKCEPLTGAEQQKCIEAAKRKFGQM